MNFFMENYIAYIVLADKHRLDCFSNLTPDCFRALRSWYRISVSFFAHLETVQPFIFVMRASKM